MTTLHEAKARLSVFFDRKGKSHRLDPFQPHVNARREAGGDRARP
jgi:hypothetical protein